MQSESPTAERAVRHDEEPLLDVTDLSVEFETSAGAVQAVNGIDLTIAPNETLGVVGESGSGKSVTALSLLRLLEGSANVSGEARFRGEDLLSKPEAEMEDVRGNSISMVFQDPGSSLNPVLTVGDQISETIRTHRSPPGEGITRRERNVMGNLFRSKRSFRRFEESWDRTVELFERVGIPLPEQRALEYPHEFSGGMKQRALIAMAISCQPDLLIADEPTTALDVTIEAQILELIDELQSEFGTAVLFITHDMGVVRKVCDRVAVMYAGSVVENAPTEELFEQPKHPYTESLLRSVPRLDGTDELDPLSGSVPDLTQLPSGCPFAPRCPAENDACHTAFPPAYSVTAGSEPLPVTAREADGDAVTDVPPGRRETATDHLVNCVLYGDADHLTARDPTGSRSDDRPEGVDR
ncbi:ABC transporter ATP-binding protein [Halorarum halobium]|uniref:ABC transporter ATP-binding protein n=1 Tax=Halorarum halobium TaxID=3075121 RepID=UPI0028A99360|nr:ABC transporter ATP-binding protein [Halobaculum sp. XH14]